MDFCKDIVEIAKQVLDHYDVDYSDLNDDRAIVERWANVQLKLIRSVPRTVFESSAIARQSDPKIVAALQTIKTKLQNGEDVNPYLTKGIFRPDYTDYLLSDWGIYHLHLSTKRDGKYFMARSDSLLFMMLSRNSAYLIDVRPHNEQFVFAQKALLDILHREWPYLIEPFRLKGVNGLSWEVNDPDSITKMRKAGVNVIHRIGTDVYAPMGGGITTAATSAQVTIEVDRLYHLAKSAMKYIGEHDKEIRECIARATGATCTSTDFHLVLTENGFFVLDRISRCGFPLNSSRAQQSPPPYGSPAAGSPSGEA